MRWRSRRGARSGGGGYTEDAVVEQAAELVVVDRGERADHLDGVLILDKMLPVFRLKNGQAIRDLEESV